MILVYKRYYGIQIDGAWYVDQHYAPLLWTNLRELSAAIKLLYQQFPGAQQILAKDYVVCYVKH